MLTQSDISKLETRFMSVFATKQELVEFKSEVLSRMDAIMFELQAMREEMVVGNYRQSEHTDTLELHDTRLTKIEKHLNLTA